MKQTSTDYTFGVASLEILLLLLGAFLLGMLLCWLLRKAGICCAHQPLKTQAPSSGHSNISPEGQRTPREFPREDLKASGYTADINSLLRNPEPSPLRHGAMTASSNIGNVAPSLTGMALDHKDDLKKLEGIGPKLEQLLNAAGIHNFAQLATMTPEELKPILEEAGSQFKMHDPKSWPYQAELANKGEWERLKEYQNLLISGQI